MMPRAPYMRATFALSQSNQNGAREGEREHLKNALSGEVDPRLVTPPDMSMLRAWNALVMARATMFYLMSSS